MKQYLTFTRKCYVLFLAQFLAQICFASNPSQPITDLGVISNLKTIKGSGERVYRFKITYTTVISIFLNGLSAGYEISLKDPKQTIIAKTANHGTKCNENSQTSEIDDPIVVPLSPGDYFLYVHPIPLSLQEIYRLSDNLFTINIIPDNAPNTVIVASYDSPKVGYPQFKSQQHDANKAINQAIASVGRLGGLVLLRPGTYHINNNIKAIFDNLTIMGTGWKTILKLNDNVKLESAGLIRSRYIDNNSNAKKDRFRNQHFMHMVLDGNKTSDTFFINSVGTYGTYINSRFVDMRVHDFPRYGFDPHENAYASATQIGLHEDKKSIPSTGITIIDCLIDHNELDGIVFQKTVSSSIINNIIDRNGRHGINIVTESTGNKIFGNVITNNGGNGIVIQPGPDFKKPANDNYIHANIIQNNLKNGIYIFRSNNNIIEKNTIKNIGKYGIHLHAASDNMISTNRIDNDSPHALDEYIGINLSGDKIIFSKANFIYNNHIQTTQLHAYKFGIAEQERESDYNQVLKNLLCNIQKPIRLKGNHSTAIDNE